MLMKISGIMLCAMVVYSSMGMIRVGQTETLTFGYLEMENDPRYKEKQLEAQFQGQPWGRPFVGAKVALRESKFSGAAAGVDFKLKRQSARTIEELKHAMTSFEQDGINFILVDAPGPVLKKMSSSARERNILLFNLTSKDDALRQKACQPNLLHVAPSQAMLMDALAQFLVSRKWRKVLVLKGPKEADAALTDAFNRAAKKFGLRIVAIKPFVLGRDPRQRSRNNVALLTSGEEYDVVFVADTESEFARDVPYQTQKPRPVTGSAGLVPDWWHWAWERHGAPQLNKRFFKKAKRRMTGYDWSAWMAVKAVVEAVQRTGSADFNKLKNYLRGGEIVLDGFKGYRLSFRSWNNQLRQPILLTTQNWVAQRAPLEGFLHDRNNLDTLGIDERESRCRLKQ